MPEIPADVLPLRLLPLLVWSYDWMLSLLSRSSLLFSLSSLSLEGLLQFFPWYPIKLKTNKRQGEKTDYQLTVAKLVINEKLLFFLLLLSSRSVLPLCLLPTP